MYSPYTEIQLINQDLLRCHLQSLYKLADGKLPVGLMVKERDIKTAPIDAIENDLNMLRAHLRKY